MIPPFTRYTTESVVELGFVNRMAICLLSIQTQANRFPNCPNLFVHLTELCIWSHLVRIFSLFKLSHTNKSRGQGDHEPIGQTWKNHHSKNDYSYLKISAQETIYNMVSKALICREIFLACIKRKKLHSGWLSTASNLNSPCIWFALYVLFEIEMKWKGIISSSKVRAAPGH